MRRAFAVLAVLFLAGGLSADEKIDAKKLIGKWEKTGDGPGFVIEFKDGGKIVVEPNEKKGEKFEGTYKVDGNKLEMAVKVGEGEHKMVRTISKLTDDELTSKDEGGKEDTIKRVKAKK